MPEDLREQLNAMTVELVKLRRDTEALIEHTNDVDEMQRLLHILYVEIPKRVQVLEEMRKRLG